MLGPPLVVRRVCGPLPNAITLVMRPNAARGIRFLNAPRFETRALEGFLCTQ